MNKAKGKEHSKSDQAGYCYRTGLTITAEHQRSGRALDPGLCDGVGHHTSVIADIWGLHFGDVQIPRLLGDEATIVLVHKRRVLVEDPGKRQVWERGRQREFLQ